jgi:hypothetical protein
MRPHTELVQIRLSGNNGPGIFQLLDYCCIERTSECIETFRGACRREVASAYVIFECDEPAIQSGLQLPLLSPNIGIFRLIMPPP